MSRSGEPWFTDRIEPVRVKASYKLAIALVAVAMVLLPLLYCAVVAGAAYAWWIYLVVGLPAILDASTNVKVIVLAFTPLVAGATLVFFLFKPLLAPRPPRANRFTLSREEAPGLFSLVEQLCDNLGAPRPIRIDVDVRVNASASLRRGLWSLFSNDLVLTVGLPLVNGLTLRQFTGVLAHEFGHFSQGVGMRLGYLIWMVNLWFARVVFVRDRWDLWLDDWSENAQWWGSSASAGLARLGVRVSRRLLHGLMLAGHRISAILSREQEFDADQSEIRTVGSRTFIETSRRLHVLDLANQWAHSDLNLAWKKGRLGDDVPALILANLRQMRQEQIAEVVAGAMDSTPGMYDSHPPTGQRIAKAEEHIWEGVFQGDGDARELFKDYVELSRRATVDYYRQILPEEFSPEQIAPTAEVAAAGEAEALFSQAGLRYFGGVVWWMKLPDPTAVGTHG